MGRAVHETRRPNVNAPAYEITRDHDAAGRVKNVYYPNNSLRVEYFYMLPAKILS